MRMKSVLAAAVIGLAACQDSRPPRDVASASASQQTGAASAVSDHACEGDPSWTAPQAPVRIHGNTYHVGPRGLGVFLITAPTGHVLIDGAAPGNAARIEANVRSLGFDPRDIKWILVSHGHCDHAGDVAELVKRTGAQVIAGTGDADLLARGGHDDPQYGERYFFPPVQVTQQAADGQVLRLGDLTLTAHLTPGHTKGSTTWVWTSCEKDRCLQMVDIGSLSAPGYRLIDHPRHPDIVADYESSFAKVAAVPCDIALAPHPEMVDFWPRVEKREAGDPDALIDRSLCRSYAAGAKSRFDAELAKQRSAPPQRD